MSIRKLHFMTIALCSLMFGCASHHRALDERDTGLTVSQIYHHSMDEIAAPVPHYHIKTAANVGYKPMSTDNFLPFKPLENPLIPIYIYPHVALIGDEQILKPGYSSAFFLYKKISLHWPASNIKGCYEKIKSMVIGRKYPWPQTTGSHC